MGGDVWMCQLSPIAPEGAHRTHFPSIAVALRHLHSPEGGSLTKLKHTQVARAVKCNAARDGWVFTHEKPSIASIMSCIPRGQLRSNGGDRHVIKPGRRGVEHAWKEMGGI